MNEWIVDRVQVYDESSMELRFSFCRWRKGEIAMAGSEQTITSDFYEQFGVQVQVRQLHRPPVKFPATRGRTRDLPRREHFLCH